MPQGDASRIEVQEGAYPLVNFSLDKFLQEMTNMMFGIGFVKFVRSDGLISRIEYYRDEEKTNLGMVQDIDRVSGATGVDLVSSVVTTVYEKDGVTIDSTVSGFLERDLTVSGSDFIQCCSGFFDTDESEKL
jgi:hypothetical protein